MFPWSKKKQELTPQRAIRDTLFGDDPLEVVAGYGTHGPWGYFANAHHLVKKRNTAGAIEELQKVLVMPGLEARVYLQTWHCLRALGQTPPPDRAKKIQGAVVEVAMDNGLDIVAGYADHSARYYNYSGAGIVWDTSDPEINLLIDRLLAVGQEIIFRIGPWNQPRPAPPPTGSVRINLLTFEGLYFGQGGYEVLSQDAMGGPAIQAAFNLMQGLTAKQQAARKG